MNHRIDGEPSVLFDAVVLLPSQKGIAALLPLPPDFVADAYAHYKFVGYAAPARRCLRAGVKPDDGFVEVTP